MNQKQQALFDKTVDDLKASFPDLVVYASEATDSSLIIQHSYGETHVNPPAPEPEPRPEGHV